VGKWGIFLPNLGTLVLWVLDERTDRQTDGQKDGQKQRLLPSFLRAGHNNNYEVGTLTVDGWAVTFGTARR